MRNIKFNLFTIALSILLIFGCSKETENITPLISEIDKENIEISFHHLSNFIEETDLNTALNQNYIDEINEKLKQVSNEQINFTLSDAYKIRSVAVDLFKNNDLSSAMAHPWFPKDEALINQVFNFRETIIKSLNEATTVEDIKDSLQQLRENILSDGIQEAKDLLLLQLDLSEKVLLQIFNKYHLENNNYNKSASFDCNFWEWICVGVSTAAAVILIASNPGSLVAVIAGGATVAAVAACCICGCDCDFTSSCRESTEPEPVPLQSIPVETEQTHYNFNSWNWNPWNINFDGLELDLFQVDYSGLLNADSNPLEQEDESDNSNPETNEYNLNEDFQEHEEYDNLNEDLQEHDHHDPPCKCPIRIECIDGECILP